MLEKLIHSKKVAERWGLCHRTLERWRWEGYGPPHIKIGGRVMYRPADIEAFENSQLRTATEKSQGRLLSPIEKQQVGGAA